jgi:hypothetical protein
MLKEAVRGRPKMPRQPYTEHPGGECPHGDGRARPA